MSNTINIKGNLGRDSEIRFTQSGAAVLNLSVADNERRWDPDQNSFADTGNKTWYSVSVWGRYAEALHETGELVTGTTVSVTGELRPREYEKDGEKRISFDVRAQAIGYQPKKQQRQAPSQGDPWRSEVDTNVAPF